MHTHTHTHRNTQKHTRTNMQYSSQSPMHLQEVHTRTYTHAHTHTSPSHSDSRTAYTHTHAHTHQPNTQRLLHSIPTHTPTSTYTSPLRSSSNSTLSSISRTCSPPLVRLTVFTWLSSFGESSRYSESPDIFTVGVRTEKGAQHSIARSTEHQGRAQSHLKWLEGSTSTWTGYCETNEQNCRAQSFDGAEVVISRLQWS